MLRANHIGRLLFIRLPEFMFIFTRINAPGNELNINDYYHYHVSWKNKIITYFYIIYSTYVLQKSGFHFLIRVLLLCNLMKE
jgi:hypothetical protein